MSLSLSFLITLAVPAAGNFPDAVEITGAENIDSKNNAEQGRYIASAPLQWAQVTIERRIIIRVPRRRPALTMPLAEIQRQSRSPKYVEKKIGKCVPMTDILGVQMSTGRNLDLITTDRRRIRAQLEKKCQARSYYSGFYMQKSGDGKMCADRDVLHSRSGAKCEIDRFRELVPDR